MLHGDSFSSTLFNVSLKTVIDKVNVTKKGIESANYTYLRKVMRYHVKMRDGKAWVEQKDMERDGIVWK